MRLGFKKSRWVGLLFLLLSSGISIIWGVSIERSSPGAMADFKAVYYGARCLLLHRDPYKTDEFLRVYQAEGGSIPSDPNVSRLFLRAVPVCINLPTGLFFVSPLAMLPWGPAHVLWMILLAVSLTLAGYLTWGLAKDYSPKLSLFLVCILLINCEILLSGGNLAGIAVSLCVVAAWCFLRGRFVGAGVLCMAVSLAIKPHDAGMVWLYFLLVGGALRRYALQSLFFAAALGLSAIIWTTQVSPHWVQEWRSNLLTTSARGELNDPGPSAIGAPNAVMIIDLQSELSLFRDDPNFYRPVSFLLCVLLFVAWTIATLRSRYSLTTHYLALAAISALSILPIYHRAYDAKLLMLTIPACAMLWEQGGPLRWIAALIDTVGIMMIGDISSALIVNLTKGLRGSTVGVVGKIRMVLLTRPVPFLILVMCVFYLWIYVQHVIEGSRGIENRS